MEEQQRKAEELTDRLIIALTEGVDPAQFTEEQCHVIADARFREARRIKEYVANNPRSR